MNTTSPPPIDGPCFGGFAHGQQQVLKSAAGYYIGDLYYDHEMEGWFPYSRDSVEYWPDRALAEHALATHSYSPNIF
jgi:hypothetical protein